MENFALDQETLLLGLAVFVAVLVFPRLRKMLELRKQFITSNDLKSLLEKDENVTVLDVRSPEEFTGPLGHIASSGNLPLADLQGRLSEIGDQLSEHKSEPVVLVCRTHNRSPKAADMLRQIGFTNIMVLKGGLTDWNNAGLPVEGATPESAA